MVYRKTYGWLLAFLLLLSCSKDPVGHSSAEPQEVLLAMDTKSAIPAFDGSNFKTFRTVLLDQVAPWKKPSSQGTYCNIYKHSGTPGLQWYHPVKCDANGNPISDINKVDITSWSFEDGMYKANGTIPEYTYSWTSGDTWGNSSSALWAKDALHEGTVVEDNMLYRLLAVSPAREMTTYLMQGDEATDDNFRSGVRMSRKEDMLFSDALPVSLRGTFLSDQDRMNHLYVYGLDGESNPSLEMHQNRSRLNVYVYVDEALGQVNLSRVVLDNYIKEAVFVPVNEQSGTSIWVYNWRDSQDNWETSTLHNGLYVHAADEPWDFDGSPDCFKFLMPRTLKYSNDEGERNDPTLAIENFYILSQDYSELNNGVPVHPQPMITLLFPSAGVSGETPVSLPLSWNFEPMHTYTLTVRIATWHFSIYIQGSAFDSDPRTPEEINYVFGEDPDQVFYIGSDVWDTGNESGENIGVI